MGAATRAVLLTLALLAAFLSTPPGALAAEEEVETPDGTYYVSEDHTVTPPEVDREALAYRVTNVCFLLAGVDGGEADVAVSLWEETNGCKGLQRVATPCGAGEELVPPDEKVAGV